ncbi:MAG: metallophosphoesterase [Lachnospiraceae bacterium]|nr:metallophosphoesterase [Lachnospiraceae bacterium]
MWALIFFGLMALGAAGLVYLISRFYKFGWVKRASNEKKWMRILLSAVTVLAIVAVLWLTMGSMNAIVCVLHLVAFWLLCDLVFWAVKKRRGKAFDRYYAGVCALIFTAIYLSVGFVLANHVWRTGYTVDSAKKVGTLRIVHIADSHVGTTFDGEGFAEYVAQMQAENPDIVVITGDYVDDDTSKQDMVDACRALGTLQTTYGVYYVFGNHDKGYYSEEYRGYNGDDLVAELEKNGVIVLEDENVLLDNRFYVIGRKDRSEEERGGKRASAAELVQGLDPDKYMIVLDHQPGEYKELAAAGVDLVLSGHTHGGQLFPVNYVGEWTGVNAKTYGLERRDGTDFLVTSGISDWAILFKTGCKSEYVVIDVTGK